MLHRRATRRQASLHAHTISLVSTSVHKRHSFPTFSQSEAEGLVYIMSPVSLLPSFPSLAVWRTSDAVLDILHWMIFRSIVP